jgi:hypothetical protein
VGEFPEAAKESCEDITPPVAKDALESWIWEKAKVGFAPTAVSLLSKVSTVAFCGSVAGALIARSLLILKVILPQIALFDMQEIRKPN